LVEVIVTPLAARYESTSEIMKVSELEPFSAICRFVVEALEMTGA